MKLLVLDSSGLVASVALIEDDQLIAERLGHSVSELRKTYAHIYSESRREMLDKLNKIL